MEDKTLKQSIFPAVETIQKERREYLINKVMEFKSFIIERLTTAGIVRFAFLDWDDEPDGPAKTHNFINVKCDSPNDSAHIIEAWAQEQGYKTLVDNWSCGICFLHVYVPTYKAG